MSLGVTVSYYKIITYYFNSLNHQGSLYINLLFNNNQSCHFHFIGIPAENQHTKKLRFGT